MYLVKAVLTDRLPSREPVIYLYTYNRRSIYIHVDPVDYPTCAGTKVQFKSLEHDILDRQES